MHSQATITAALRGRAAELGYDEQELARRADLAPEAVRAVLRGDDDFTLVEVLSVAHAVGLDLEIVPRPAAALAGSEVTEPKVLTAVHSALGRVRGKG